MSAPAVEAAGRPLLRLAEAPEELRRSPTPELQPSTKIRIHDVRVGSINVLSQTREGENDVQAALTESIARRGLINPVNIGVLTPKLMAEYVKWTNHTWGSSVSLEELTPLQLEEDYVVDGEMVACAGDYLQLVAGHSRLKGVKAAAVEQSRDPDEETVPSQLKRYKSLLQLLADQIDENLHCQVPILRNLRAVAEMYRYEKDKALRAARARAARTGVKVNPRQVGPTQEEFARRFGVKAGIVSLAMNYSDLDPQVRELTLDGRHESVGLWLARIRPIMYRYAAYHFSHDDSYANLAPKRTHSQRGEVIELERRAKWEGLLDDYVKREMLWLIQRTNNLDGNNRVLAGIAIIREHGKALKETLDRELGRKASREVGLFELSTEVDRSAERRHADMQRLIAEYGMGERARQHDITTAIADVFRIPLPKGVTEADQRALAASLIKLAERIGADIKWPKGFFPDEDETQTGATEAS